MSMNHEPLRYAHDEGHTDVCFTADGSKFISCGADGDIRIWSVKDDEDPIHNCIGEWALCVRQQENNLYVATGSNDIQILTLPDGNRDGVLERYTAPINHIATAKKKKIVALAGEDMEVKLIDLSNEEKEIHILDGLNGPVLSVAICPDAEYLAASCGDTKLRIWNIESKSLLKEFNCVPKTNSFSNAKVLCRMDFNPKRGELLAYPEEQTVVVYNIKDCTKICTLSCDEASGSYSIAQYSPCGNYILATTEEGDFVLWEVSSETVLNISKHPKGTSISGLMWNPLNNGQVVYTDVEGQLGIITDCIDKSSKAQDGSSLKVDENGFTENEVDFGDVQFEDDDEDNENAISVEKLKREYMGDVEPELENLEKASSAPTPRPRTPEIPLQEPFMPSSTPEHLDPRYLCWNDIGVVRSYGLQNSEEGTTKSIEVEFNDSSFHKSLMMQNFQDYTMAALSKGALVVANINQMNVIPLQGIAKEWMVNVEEFEEIVLVASSENLVCQAMANYTVRIFSVHGTQRAMVSIPGPIVSLSAYKNFLLVAYHSGAVRKNDQCINFKLIKFEGLNVESKDLGSALGPESTLLWVGFSDMGTPGMMDSQGMLSLYPYNCNIWIPYCDTTRHRKSPSDGFFVTSVFESFQTVGGIKCKGSVYPGFTPRPTICELPLEPPFAEPNTEKTQMEANLFAWSTLQVANIDRKYKEAALKTFALACNNDLEERALEFMETIMNSQILNLAIKFASKKDKMRLAEKLMNLAAKIDNDGIENSLPVFDSTLPQENSIKPSVKKLSLSSRLTPRNKKNNVTMPEVEQDTQQTDVLTPSNVSKENSFLSNTLEDVSIREEPKNPFLKKLQKQSSVSNNPLSLTDENAGVNFEKENKKEASEKRKLSDSDNENKKGKQRKLDMFAYKRKENS